jgi:hypothetical protein
MALDLMPVLVGEARRAFEGSGATLWWYDDTHWNERGHEVAAAAIGAWLEAARSPNEPPRPSATRVAPATSDVND